MTQLPVNIISSVYRPPTALVDALTRFIGDEYYYLIRCDYFLHERQLFINKYYIRTPKCLQIYPTHADREL